MKIKKIKSSRILKRVAFFVVACAFGWYLHGKMMPAFSGADGWNQTPFVLISGLKKQDVSPKKKFIAQAEAINSVDIIPQVSGYLEKVLFQNGSLVQKGDNIFLIEQRKYKADLKSAEAAVFQLKRDYERMEKLHKSGDIPDKQLDIAQSALQQAEAQLDLARLNLEYSEIKAPITGRIGKALVTEGNLVSPNAQKLARIVQTDPIRIAFSVTDKERANFLKKAKEDKVFADIRLPDGNIKSVSASKMFSDNEVNPDTATIPVYIDLENADMQLIPGNYVDIYIRFGEKNESLLVPQVALSADVNGTYVMTVNQENIAEQKYVKLGDVVEDNQVVLSGLNESDRVIVQGLQRVKNGSKVNPTLIGE